MVRPDLDFGCALRCGRAARVRGLCQTCYQKALAQVRAGEVEWEELEAAGKARAPAGRRDWKTPEEYRRLCEGRLGEGDV